MNNTDASETLPSNVVTVPQKALRVKVTDRCAWNCFWCHNEGTGPRNPRLVGDMNWDNSFSDVISQLRNALNLQEIHLTGGEPTKNPDLPNIVKGLTDMGLVVKATTVGCSTETLKKLISSGLRSFNFSLHAINFQDFHKTQVERSLRWSQQQLEQELASIFSAIELGATVKLNLVVSSVADLARISDVFEWAMQHNVQFRLMNELKNDEQAIDAINEFLDSIKGKLIQRIQINGSSSYLDHYLLPNGKSIGVKLIRNLFLESMCANCQIRQAGNCSEHFYGIRLEKRLIAGDWKYLVRLCIHKSVPETLIPVGEFLRSPQLQEIVDLNTVVSENNESDLR